MPQKNSSSLLGFTAMQKRWAMNQLDKRAIMRVFLDLNFVIANQKPAPGLSVRMHDWNHASTGRSARPLVKPPVGSEYDTKASALVAAFRSAPRRPC
jgi:hypothetical protein